MENFSVQISHQNLSAVRRALDEVDARNVAFLDELNEVSFKTTPEKFKTVQKAAQSNG